MRPSLPQTGLSSLEQILSQVQTAVFSSTTLHIEPNSHVIVTQGSERQNLAIVLTINFSYTMLILSLFVKSVELR